MSENEREPRWSLKEREYVGDDGQIHHHTNVWMEQHAADGRSGNGRGSSEGSRSSGSRSGSERESGGERPSSSRGSGESSSREARSTSRRASGESRSGTGGSRGRSGGRRKNGGEEQSEGGLGRSILAAATLGLATMAAVALVARRREARREPDIYPGRREETTARDRDPDGSGSESGMY